MNPDKSHHRRLAPIGLPLSRIALGTVGFRRERRESVFARLDAFVDLGGTLVDTAYSYEGGEAEAVLGDWLRARGRRDDLVLLTKCGHPDAAWRSRVRPEVVAGDLSVSLDRLGTDHVDVLLLHRDDPAIPAGELVAALDAEVRAGRARAIGLSNWTPARLEEAVAHAAGHRLAPIAVSSPYLGLAHPNGFPWPGCVAADDAVSLDWHARHPEVALLAWSAQSGGFFADDFDPSRPSAAGTVASYQGEENVARRERARTLAAERGVTTAEIALAWVLEQPIRPLAAIGVRDPAHLRRAWRALDVTLTPADLHWLATGER
jgi:1-deoxyxylulose-5-phosphate synthase